MTSTPKPNEGTVYVSHTITPVPLRRSPSKRWEVVVETSVPEGMPHLPFNGLFDIPVETKRAGQVKKLIDTFVAGMKKRWNKRTSSDDAWLEDLRADLEKVVDEG
jgi:hypothetical protein